MPYLITFSTYGTHLPGDARGSTNRHMGRMQHEPALEYHARTIAVEPPFLLESPGDRRIVLNAIVGVCQYRNWNLHALHIRTTHVHGIVTAATSPERVLGDWKAYATRALSTQNERQPYWARSGHIRTIADSAITTAVDYVLNRQGERMEAYEASPG